MKYLFGPVISRRLGISLGIDLLPFKTCSLDCVYCECRKTTNLTTSISEYVPTGEVIAELSDFLDSKPKLDVITFSGSGEPTLHSGIGKIISFIKDNYPEYKVSVLTNSTLLYLSEVRKSILDADIIVPSLDAVSKEMFIKITRPANDITPEDMINGLIELRHEFSKLMILEIFIIPDFNDSEFELSLIKNACNKISPDLIQLNSLDRPGTEKWLKKASQEKLQEIKDFFQPVKVEIIGSPAVTKNKISRRFSDISDHIVSTISRRPSTIEDLHSIFGISKSGLLNILDHLLEKGTIVKEESSRGIFYRIITSTKE
jgi:wyosine [tRNA(Phe)-imidazoG37] synthetase (radical SAM superfamily)